MEVQNENKLIGFSGSNANKQHLALCNLHLPFMPGVEQQMMFGSKRVFQVRQLLHLKTYLQFGKMQSS